MCCSRILWDDVTQFFLLTWVSPVSSLSNTNSNLGSLYLSRLKKYYTTANRAIRRTNQGESNQISPDFSPSYIFCCRLQFAKNQGVHSQKNAPGSQPVYMCYQDVYFVMAYHFVPVAVCIVDLTAAAAAAAHGSGSLCEIYQWRRVVAHLGLHSTEKWAARARAKSGQAAINKLDCFCRIFWGVFEPVGNMLNVIFGRPHCLFVSFRK